MAQAKREVLADLGITDLWARRAMTNALILEIRDPEDATKTEALADRLRKAAGKRLK